MPFNSFNFWLVFPFIFVIYWAIPRRCNMIRNIFLLAVSYLLYLNWNPVCAITLAGVTLICYLGGVWIVRFSNKRKRIGICCFTLLGLLPLILFKYYNFLNVSMTSLLYAVGIKFALPGLNWAIPVGLSFFTFQSVGYLLDVYKKRTDVERNLINFSLFVSFFPQVTSGPISTAEELMPQIKSPHKFNYTQGVNGLKLLLWGMFLKCVVADRLGLYVDTVYSNYEFFSGVNCFIASVFYSFQIYGDFAGYSLMSIGIAKTLGFDLINNFRQSYLATSITDFWKRWHISLTRWLTTHVYINLGGNRCSRMRQYYNIFITFLVSGLWHGANWTFVAWGAIHGFFQIIEKSLGLDPKGRFGNVKSKSRSIRIIIVTLRILITFMIVNFAWILFRMNSIYEAFDVVCHIFNDSTNQSLFYKMNNKDIMFSLIAIITVLCFDLRQEFFVRKLAWQDNRLTKWIVYVTLFCMILSMGVLDAGTFIYVSF